MTNIPHRPKIRYNFGMQIITQSGGFAATNGWLIADELSNQAVLFDAPDGVGAALAKEAKSRGWDLIGLWLTHGHWDHVADHAAVTEVFHEAKILLHASDFEKLRDPMAGLTFRLPNVIAGREADGELTNGQSLTLGSLTFEVMHTPGHCPGHVCFYCASEGILVGGDNIICGAIGRTDFLDADEDALVESIRRTMKLPGETKLLPGHCGPSTLVEEAQGNSYVRAMLERGQA